MPSILFCPELSENRNWQEENVKIYQRVEIKQHNLEQIKREISISQQRTMETQHTKTYGMLLKPFPGQNFSDDFL